MSLTDLGCPRVCWISRALLAGAEASQATVRDFAFFFFFRLTAGDGKLCEGCGSTVSHDCHGGWVVRGHGSQRITDGSKFQKISCCSSSSYLNTLECINLSKRKHKYIFLRKPLSGIFFSKTFSSLKTGSLNLAGIYPLTEHGSCTLSIKIEIMLCL